MLVYYRVTLPLAYIPPINIKSIWVKSNIVEENFPGDALPIRGGSSHKVCLFQASDKKRRYNFTFLLADRGSLERRTTARGLFKYFKGLEIKISRRNLRPHQFNIFMKG